MVPYGFTYGDFKLYKTQTKLIDDERWKEFNDAISQNNRCKKSLRRKTNRNCKLDFENKFVNDPEEYDGGSSKKTRRSKINYKI